MLAVNHPANYAVGDLCADDFASLWFTDPDHDHMQSKVYMYIYMFDETESLFRNETSLTGPN